MNRLTKLLNIFLLTSLLVFYSSLTYAIKVNENTQTLTLFNWPDYIAPELIKAFEKKYNIKVNEVFFDSDDERDKVLLQTGGEGLDVISVNGSSIASFIDIGWIQKLPLKNIPNLTLIDKRWLTAFKSSKNYAVPYFWGLLGIVYRKDLVPEKINSWMQLFKPAKELQGKVVMVKSSRDLIGVALLSLGYSANSADEKQLQQAKALLLQQKPHLARLGYLRLSKDSDIIKGKVIAASIYGGDALNLAQYHKDIVYVNPKEGGSYWIDFFAVSAKSKNPELAATFINFINEPKWAALNASKLFLPTPINAARKYISEEMLTNPLIYPSPKDLKSSEFHVKLHAKNERLRASIFSKVTN